MSIKLTVYFEEPFWVGVWERESEVDYSVCRTVFGPEPRNHQIMELAQSLHRLQFSEPIALEGRLRPDRINPKRMQRAISRDLSRPGVSTKAQAALQKQHEAGKQERKELSKAAREETDQRKYALKQAKKRKKHRGH